MKNIKEKIEKLIWGKYRTSIIILDTCREQTQTHFMAWKMYVSNSNKDAEIQIIGDIQMLPITPILHFYIWIFFHTNNNYKYRLNVVNFIIIYVYFFFKIIKYFFVYIKILLIEKYKLKGYIYEKQLILHV